MLSTTSSLKGTTVLFLALAILFSSNNDNVVHAFVGTSPSTTTKSTIRRMNMLPVEDVIQQVASSASSSGNANELLSHSPFWLSKIGEGDMGEITKSVLIVLALGGGLIPASISANKAMMDTLMGGGKKSSSTTTELSEEQKKTSLDPTNSENAPYIESSGATGPTLPGANLLFASEPIPLADIIAVVGRMTPDVNSVADWKNLPSTKLQGTSATNPPMWLPRTAFKANIRNANFNRAGWPVDQKGNPIGGEALKKAEESRIKKRGAEIGDAALDAVFDTWAWGAGVATPDKVQSQLNQWRTTDNGFDLDKFTKSAIAGRAVTGLAAVTFVVIQVVAYGTLFIAPALRLFLDIDIGFGDVGQCDPETCVHLFQ